MSLRLRIGRGVLKIKPRWQMRSFERDRKLPVLDLGMLIIAWWSNADQLRYERR